MIVAIVTTIKYESIKIINGLWNIKYEISNPNTKSVLPNCELLKHNNMLFNNILVVATLPISAITNDTDLLGNLGISFFSSSKNILSPFFKDLFVK